MVKKKRNEDIIFNMLKLQTRDDLIKCSLASSFLMKINAHYIVGLKQRTQMSLEYGTDPNVWVEISNAYVPPKYTARLVEGQAHPNFRWNKSWVVAVYKNVVRFQNYAQFAEIFPKIITLVGQKLPVDCFSFVHDQNVEWHREKYGRRLFLRMGLQTFLGHTGFLNGDFEDLKQFRANYSG